MNHLSDEQIKTFIEAGRRIAGYGMVRYSSGNLSWRVTDNHAAVSCKGSWLGELSRDNIALCRIEDGEIIGDAVPSVEKVFHLGIFRARPDINVVLHCQLPCATAVASCDDRTIFDFNCIPEVPFYVGKVAWIDYLNPGSPELANSVVDVMKDHNLALLCNHGQVAVGSNFDLVIQRAGFFELACEIMLKDNGKRLNLRSISGEDIEALRQRAALEIEDSLGGPANILP